MQMPSAGKLRRESQKLTLPSDSHTENDMYAAQEAGLCPLLPSSHSRVPTVPRLTYALPPGGRVPDEGWIDPLYLFTYGLPSTVHAR